MRRGVMVAMAFWAAAGTGGCADAESVEVQPLPPLERPSMEARAGLPEVAGVWRFAGFEIPPGDTASVRARVYPMTPPGELAIETQRLDSIAGRYLRDGAAFPFSGEVRRDGTFALVAFAGGEGSFAAGKVHRDTLWLELTSFAVASAWPAGTRAGLVRRPSGEPFVRLLGGAPVTAPVDSAALADSARLEALRRAGEQPPAEAVPPGVAPPPPAEPAQPQRPRPEQPAEPRPQQPAPQRPDPAPQPPAREPEPARPEPPVREPEPPPPPDTPRQPVTPEPPPAEPPAPVQPPPAGPRDTIRMVVPPG